MDQKGGSSDRIRPNTSVYSTHAITVECRYGRGMSVDRPAIDSVVRVERTAVALKHAPTSQSVLPGLPLSSSRRRPTAAFYSLAVASAAPLPLVAFHNRSGFNVLRRRLVQRGTITHDRSARLDSGSHPLCASPGTMSAVSAVLTLRQLSIRQQRPRWGKGMTPVGHLHHTPRR